MGGADVERTIEAVWRMESARLIAGIARMVRDVGLTEDFAHRAVAVGMAHRPAAASRYSPAGPCPRHYA